MKYLKVVLQILVLCGISIIGNLLAQIVDVGIPGNLIGMGILFVLLERNVIALEWIERGANFLIAELLLFFIPSAIGIIQYKSLFASHLGALLFVIIFSTVAVLVFVALSTELVSRYRGRRGKVC